MNRLVKVLASHTNWRAVVLVLIGLTACSSGHGPTQTASNSPSDERAAPSVLVSGLESLANGNFTNEIQIKNAVVGEGNTPLVTMMHPASAGMVTIEVPQRPASLRLEVCPVAIDRSPLGDCASLASERVDLVIRGGGDHKGLIIRAPGAHPSTTIAEIDLTYEAVDNYVEVDLS